MPPLDDPVQRNFLLPAEQAEWLREHAFRTRRKQAEVVREALSEYRSRTEATDDQHNVAARHRALVKRFSAGEGLDLATLRDQGRGTWRLEP